jgi:hypothetical protein
MGANASHHDIAEDSIIDFETLVRPIPQYDPSDPLMISQGPSLCIFNKDDPQEVLASWIFMQYMLSNDVQIAYSQTEGYAPVTTKARETEEYRDYLARAGQIPKGVAGLAKAFMIHPEIVMKKGKMGLGRFYIGSRESVWKKYIKTCLRAIKHADKRILFVTYVGLTIKEQAWIRDMVEKHVKLERIIFQKASPAIAVNSGPGTFGLLFMDKE